MTGFMACDSQTGKNTTSVSTESEQMDGNQTGIVNPNQNDTTGAGATEKTQTRVGNSQSRGEQNTSNSRTTQNQVLGDSTQQQ